MENPDLALDHEIAYGIMSRGMRDGMFTGRKLAQFIGPGQCDYVNARKIINGLDQADRIASYARELEQVLAASVVKATVIAAPGIATPAPERALTSVEPVPAVAPVPAVGNPVPFDLQTAAAPA